MNSHNAPSQAPQATPETDPLSRAGKLWMAALLTGVAIAASSAAWDSAHRGELEKVVQATAVGDSDFYPLQAKPSIRFQGEDLKPSASPVESFPDSQMRIVGEAEGGAFRLYVPVERVNGAESLGGPSWYVKVANGKFVRFSR